MSSRTYPKNKRTDRQTLMILVCLIINRTSGKRNQDPSPPVTRVLIKFNDLTHGGLNERSE